MSDALGQTVSLDTVETLRGKRWATLKQRLPEEKSIFHTKISTEFC